MPRVTARMTATGCLLSLAGCSVPPLMRTPVMLSDGGPDPYRDTHAEHLSNTIEVFYATDRNVASPGAPQPYGTTRGHVLRLGTVSAMFGDADLEWTTFHAESLSADRSVDLPPAFLGVEEIGILSETLHFMAEQTPEVREPDREYAALINHRLDESTRRHVYIYVSQFLTGFADAAVISSELFHYLGQDGAFILYSWPSPTSTTEYFVAAENAYDSVQNLRIFIEYLARETRAEQIHLMSYSAGARVLAGALKELALIHDEDNDAEVHGELRLGQVVFAAPDIDFGLMQDHYEDGFARIAKQMTIYTTTMDKALGFSRFLLRGNRAGSMAATDFAPETIRHLQEQERISFVDVSNADLIEELGSHGYFHASPWVSSDLVLILRHGLLPSKRGLIRLDGDPIWRFPDDYPDRVREIARMAYAADR